jgi:hypothetical protein
MRKVLSVVVVVLWVAAVVPSQAQDVFAFIGAGQEGCALFIEEVEGGSLQADVCGINFLELATDAGPADGTYGCAAVGFFPTEETPENPAFLDIGCGSFTVEVDPLLQTAHLAGSLETELINLTTFDSVGASVIDFDVDLTATGVPTAGAGEGADVFTYPLLIAGAGAIVFTGADGDGSIESAELGAPAGPAVDALIDEGVGLFVAAIV